MRGDPPSSSSCLHAYTVSTPHARGSTGPAAGHRARVAVYPACAGIHLFWRKSHCRRIRLPRMRGDPPKMSPFVYQVRKSTPHARGSTLALVRTSPIPKVYPACAGIHPLSGLTLLSGVCLPRMRGDPPWIQDFVKRNIGSTPHARGSTCMGPLMYGSPDVYPACAGIHLNMKKIEVIVFGLPRMRGDPPLSENRGSSHWLSTPHARGSTHSYYIHSSSSSVYPACAGIHLSQAPTPATIAGLPRMRGDPPCGLTQCASPLMSTPHARGSTSRISKPPSLMAVYPACAGIHPPFFSGFVSFYSLPRMRGDPPSPAPVASL